MAPKTPELPSAEPASKSGPLTELVDDQLNKPLATQVVEELEKRDEIPRSGSTDYARGTAEHDDDTEA
jgi:hypothetical protein